ncbi:hypothetical protein GIB67_007691 [Kingdonia uniflora]|uniref:DUF6857 domain-containing protein n=1 Tax=Kingdonia uniflora TaxID=39325 RepID=A0A7J7N1Z4_9MAGN|nr:hypothetical protein GIB67_007691 [Kingdonia uniflora]
MARQGGFVGALREVVLYFHTPEAQFRLGVLVFVVATHTAIEAFVQTYGHGGETLLQHFLIFLLSVLLLAGVLIIRPLISLLVSRWLTSTGPAMWLERLEAWGLRLSTFKTSVGFTATALTIWIFIEAEYKLFLFSIAAPVLVRSLVLLIFLLQDLVAIFANVAIALLLHFSRSKVYLRGSSEMTYAYVGVTSGFIVVIVLDVLQTKLRNRKDPVATVAAPPTPLSDPPPPLGDSATSSPHSGVLWSTTDDVYDLESQQTMELDTGLWNTVDEDMVGQAAITSCLSDTNGGDIPKNECFLLPKKPTFTAPKITVRDRKWTDRSTLFDGVTVDLARLGKEALRRRTEAMEEASVTESIIMNLRRFSDLCSSSKAEHPLVTIRRFLALYELITESLALVESLVANRLSERSDNNHPMVSLPVSYRDASTWSRVSGVKKTLELAKNLQHEAYIWFLLFVEESEVAGLKLFEENSHGFFFFLAHGNLGMTNQENSPMAAARLQLKRVNHCVGIAKIVPSVFSGF